MRWKRAAAIAIPEYEATYEASHDRVLEAFSDFHKAVERVFPTGTVTIAWKHEPIFHVVVNGVPYGVNADTPKLPTVRAPTPSEK